MKSSCRPPLLSPSTMNQDFTPRKEFLRQTSHPLNSFSLLTFSSSSLVRLYSFPPPVVTTLRRLLQHRKSVSAYREEPFHGYCEFTLVGKPWSRAKSVTSERLVLNVLAVVLQHGYTLLSPLDYGRETDDRLALAFSKPTATMPRSSASGSNQSPSSPFHSTSPQSPRPISSNPGGYVIPFAVSFASSTTIRVISPPLDSTPAILQAVRGSWPRGVISEKKVGDSAYEFKLRGYRCTSLGLAVHSFAPSKVVRFFLIRVSRGYILGGLPTTHAKPPRVSRFPCIYSTRFPHPLRPFTSQGSMGIHRIIR